MPTPKRRPTARRRRAAELSPGKRPLRLQDIPGISPKVLTERLRALEEKGVVTREVMPSSPPSVEYTLSEVGHELVPVIGSIVRVGTRLLGR
ncbi:MAG: helix-turn-helix domain-containing protein [Usitatibacter sp.]